jgi:hypothetical protein
VPLLALLRGADLLAPHVVVDALEQLGERARQKPELVAAAQSCNIEVDLVVGPPFAQRLHSQPHCRRALRQQLDAADDAQLDRGPGQHDRGQHRDDDPSDSRRNAA